MLYVAYGSNLNYPQMNFRCPNAKVVDTGFIYDYKLHFNYHADIIPDLTNKVPVLVWDIKDANDWKTLDRYEGYPKYYVKRIVPVVLDSGRIVRCIVYVMSKTNQGTKEPSVKYLKTILDGYMDNDLNLSYLSDALEEAKNYEKLMKKDESVKL